MRKIVAGFAASLDGYIEGPKGEIDWILIDEKIDFADYFRRFDAFLFGRKTYEKAVEMFRQPAKGISNYVFSNTLTSVDPNFVLVNGNLREKTWRFMVAPTSWLRCWPGNWWTRSRYR